MSRRRVSKDGKKTIWQKREEEKFRFSQTTFVIGVFAFISWLFVLFVYNYDNIRLKTLALHEEKIVSIPIDVERTDRLYQLEFYHPFSSKLDHLKSLVSPQYYWVWLQIDILNEDKNLLGTFTHEFWKEEGRDEEGYWSDTDSDVRIPVHFDDVGRYYINVSPKSSGKKTFETLRFDFRSLWGNDRLPYFFAIILTILFIIMRFSSEYDSKISFSKLLDLRKVSAYSFKALILLILSFTFILIASASNFGVVGHGGFLKKPAFFYTSDGAEYHPGKDL